MSHIFFNCSFQGAHDGIFMACARDQDSLRFLLTLSNRDPNIRNQAFEAIRRNIDLWISGNYGSPVPPVNTTEICDLQNDFDMKLSKVQERLPDFLRIIHSCPFSDISEKCQWILEDLQVGRSRSSLKLPKFLSFICNVDNPQHNRLFLLLHRLLKIDWVYLLVS